MGLKIVKTIKFDKNESCEMGLRHPIYVLLDEAKKLNPNEGLRVLVNDYDWLMVIRNTIALLKDLGYRDVGDIGDSFHEIIIYRA